MKINIHGERFRDVYDSTRVRWGLPDTGSPSHPDAHKRVMRHAAVCIVSSDAQKRGHNPQVQGLTLECSRCGASCAIDESDWTVRGSLTRGACDGKA